MVGPNGAGKSTSAQPDQWRQHPGLRQRTLSVRNAKRHREKPSGRSSSGSASSPNGSSSPTDRTPRPLDAVASGFFDSNGLYRIPTPAQRAEARRWMDLLGIARFADKLFERLSFGERRMINDRTGRCEGSRTPPARRALLRARPEQSQAHRAHDGRHRKPGSDHPRLRDPPPRRLACLHHPHARARRHGKGAPVQVPRGIKTRDQSHSAAVCLVLFLSRPI